MTYQFYTVEDAADALGVHVGAIFALIRHGLLRSEIREQRRRINAADVERLRTEFVASGADTISSFIARTKRTSR